MHPWNVVPIPAREVRVGDRLVVSGTAIVAIGLTRSGETLLVTEIGTKLPMPSEQLVWVARHTATAEIVPRLDA